MPPRLDSDESGESATNPRTGTDNNESKKEERLHKLSEKLSVFAENESSMNQLIKLIDDFALPSSPKLELNTHRNKQDMDVGESIHWVVEVTANTNESVLLFYEVLNDLVEEEHATNKVIISVVYVFTDRRRLPDGKNLAKTKILDPYCNLFCKWWNYNNERVVSISGSLVCVEVNSHVEENARRRDGIMNHQKNVDAVRVYMTGSKGIMKPLDEVSKYCISNSPSNCEFIIFQGGTKIWPSTTAPR